MFQWRWLSVFEIGTNLISAIMGCAKIEFFMVKIELFMVKNGRFPQFPLLLYCLITLSVLAANTSDQ